MNYNELLAEVPVVLRAQNSTLTNVNTFAGIVRDAVNQVVNLLDHEAFKTTISGQEIPTTGSFTLASVDPPVLEIRSIEIRLDDAASYPTRPLIPRQVETLAALYPGGTTGAPQFYAETAHLVLQVFPRPASSVFAEVRVNQRPATLSVSSPTNVLTDRYPRILDNAVLRRAALFMKDYDALARYEAELAAAAQEVNAEVGRHRRDESSQRPRSTENVTGQ